MFKNKAFLTIFLIMVTEVLGFSLILPFLPVYALELGASPLVISLIFSSFSLFQFFSAPILGKLSDLYGRKPLLLLSQFSTFISFVLLGFSNTILLIFISRLIDGLFGSNFTIAQAYLSDISTRENRSKAFGLSGAAFGIGFLVGPAFGGILAQINPNIPAFIAAFISLITIFITHKFLKETITHKTNTKVIKNIKFLDLNSYKRFFKEPKTKNLLYTLFFFLLTHITFVSNFAVYTNKKLGLGTLEIGLLLTYVGLISVILRGFLLSKLIDKFGELKLLYAGFVFICIGLFGLFILNTYTMLFFFITFFSTGSGLIRPILFGFTSRNVSEKNQGELLGVTGSLGSIAQIVGPLLGGYILNITKPSYLGLLTFAIVCISFFIAIKSRNILQSSV